MKVLTSATKSKGAPKVSVNKTDTILMQYFFLILQTKNPGELSNFSMKTDLDRGEESEGSHTSAGLDFDCI